MDALLDKQKAPDGAFVADTQQYDVEDYEVAAERLVTVKTEIRIITVKLENRIVNG